MYKYLYINKQRILLDILYNKSYILGIYRSVF
jgi:hypothetical protein